MTPPRQPLDSRYNYLGVEFRNALWEDVSRCCIFPPDAAFCETERCWEDAVGSPLSPPEDGWDGHHIIILWRMDEPEDQRQTRPRLHAILAAFAHLFSRRVARPDALRIVYVRYGEKPQCSSELPAVNFRLWQNIPFVSCSFLLEQVEGREYEKTLPASLPPCAVEVHEAAAADWCRLVYEQLEFLLDSMVDAAAYGALKATLDEWYSYSHQIPLREEVQRERYDGVETAVGRLPFMPWYPEALRRMPWLNKLGVCLVPLASIGRYALLDYRPEEYRRFCLELRESFPGVEGRLRLASEGEKPLPYDARKHLHLLPIGTDEHMPRLSGVKCSPWNFDEDWL